MQPTETTTRRKPGPRAKTLFDRACDAWDEMAMDEREDLLRYFQRDFDREQKRAQRTKPNGDDAPLFKEQQNGDN